MASKASSLTKILLLNIYSRSFIEHKLPMTVGMEEFTEY